MLTIVKLLTYAVVGFIAIVCVVGNTNVQTPWKYTVHSTIAPGTQITVTQPDGEPVHAEVTKTTSHKQTLDVGAVAFPAATYLLGGFMVFMLKGRRRNFTECCNG